MIHIDSRDWERCDSPYEHWICENILRAQSDDILEWLQKHAAWHRHTGSFYDQFECLNVLDRNSPFRFLLEQAEPLRKFIEEIISEPLHPFVHFDIHRLTTGQAIGFHTDDPGEDRETHRLIVMLPSSPHLKGGNFILTKNREMPNDAMGYEHHPGAAVLMSFGASSYHAVSRIETGTRYSLVVSFWSRRQTVPDVPKTSTISFDSCSDLAWPALEAVERRCALRVTPHSRGELIPHLVGTHEILRSWKLRSEVCLAGLYHSVYGTRDYQTATFDDSERPHVAELIGANAESLAHRYCRLDKVELRRLVAERSREIDPDILAIDLANELEQIPRCSASAEDHEYLVAGLHRLGLNCSQLTRIIWNRRKERSIAVQSEYGVERTIDEISALFPDHIIRARQRRDGVVEIATSERTLQEAKRDVELRSGVPLLGLPPDASMCSLGIFRRLRLDVNDYVVLNHSAALRAWAYGFPEQGDATLIHVDAHDDLGSIKIAPIHREVYACPLSDRTYSLKSAADVRRLLEHGYLAIGNFVTLALAAGWFSRLIYVNEFSIRPRKGFIEIRKVTIPLLGSHIQAIVATWCIEPSCSGDELITRIPAVTCGLGELSDHIHRGENVALDVDLDFACNHLDNSTTCSWPTCDVGSVIKRIDAVRDLQTNLSGQCKITTWALSPDFFPSKLWGAVFGSQSIDWI